MKLLHNPNGNHPHSLFKTLPQNWIWEILERSLHNFNRIHFGIVFCFLINFCLDGVLFITMKWLFFLYLNSSSKYEGVIFNFPSSWKSNRSQDIMSVGLHVLQLWMLSGLGLDTISFCRQFNSVLNLDKNQQLPQYLLYYLHPKRVWLAMNSLVLYIVLCFNEVCIYWLWFNRHE